MPNKYELAQYLVNLDTLMNSQNAIGGERSQALAEEYARVWTDLKAAIKKDKPK